MQQRDVVIIGGGPAGRVIVHALHSQNSGKSVTLIKDEEINVNRCAVPYGISDNKPIEKFKIPNKLVTDFGAELVVYRAVKIDTNRKQVHTQNGQSYGYQDLVLATGSKPLVPPIAGVDLAGVTPVRSLKDLVTLRGFAVLSVGVVPNIELAAEAGIQMGATLEDLLSYQYATHPELAAKPSDNAYVFAARDAYDKL